MKKILKKLLPIFDVVKNQVLRHKLGQSDNWRTVFPFRGTQIWVSKDNKIENAIFVEGDGYDYSNFSLVAHLVKPGFTCLDIGANIGIYSMVFSHLSGDPANVHAFEPVNHIRSRLLANAKLNGFSSLQVNDCALGEQEEAIEMYQVKEGVFRGGTSSFLENENVQAMGSDKFDKKPVQVIKLDRYCHDKNLSSVDFIKIDVEGFELNVLKGGLETIRSYRPYILMEYDDIRHGPQKESFKNFFTETGYRVYEFYIVAGTPVLKPYTFSKNPVHRNIVAIPL